MALEDPGAKWDRRKDTFANLALAVLIIAVVAGGSSIVFGAPEIITGPVAVGGIVGSIGLAVLSLLADRWAYEARQPRIR